MTLPNEPKDDLDKTWDRADFASGAAWRVMDEFLKEMAAEIKANGRPPTPEEIARYSARYIEIMQRCSAKALEIFERASAGDPAPHLKSVKK
jgi:hypothetical protein